MVDVTSSQSNGGALPGGGSMLRSPGMAFCALTPGSLPPRKRLSVGWKQNGCFGCSHSQVTPVMYHHQSISAASVPSPSTPQPQNRYHHSQAPSSSTSFARPSPARPPDEKDRYVGDGGNKKNEERAEGEEEDEEEEQGQKERREVVLSEPRWGNSVVKGEATSTTTELNGGKNRCAYGSDETLPLSQNRNSQQQVHLRRTTTGPRTPRELVISTVGLGASAGNSLCCGEANAGSGGTSNRLNKLIVGKCSHCRAVVGSVVGEAAEDVVNKNGDNSSPILSNRVEKRRCEISISLPTEKEKVKKGGGGQEYRTGGGKSCSQDGSACVVEQQQQQRQGGRREPGHEEHSAVVGQQHPPLPPPPPPSTPPSSSKMSASMVRLPVWGTEFAAVKSTTTTKSKTLEHKLKSKQLAVAQAGSTAGSNGSGGSDQNPSPPPAPPPAPPHHSFGAGDVNVNTNASGSSTRIPQSPQGVESYIGGTKKDCCSNGNTTVVNRNVLKTRNTVDVGALSGGSSGGPRCAPKSIVGCGGATSGEGGGESSSGPYHRGSTLRLPINIILPSRASPVRKKPRGVWPGSKETSSSLPPSMENVENTIRHRCRQHDMEGGAAGVVVIKVTGSAATASAAAAAAAAFSSPRPSSDALMGRVGGSINNALKAGGNDGGGTGDRVSGVGGTVGGVVRRRSGSPAGETIGEEISRGHQERSGEAGSGGGGRGSKSPSRVHLINNCSGTASFGGGGGAAAAAIHASSSSSGDGRNSPAGSVSAMAANLEKASVASPTPWNLNAPSSSSSPPRSPSSNGRDRSPSPPYSPSPSRCTSAPRSPPRSLSPARPALGTQEAADAARAEAELKMKLAAAARAAANGKAALAARAAAAARAAIEYAALAKEWEMNAKAQQQQRKARSALMRGLGSGGGGDGKAGGEGVAVELAAGGGGGCLSGGAMSALGSLKLQLLKLKADRGERGRSVVFKGENIREDGGGSEETARGGGAGGGLSLSSSPVDDEELARRLHRAINSSPRISGSLPLKRKSIVESSSSGGGGGGRWLPPSAAAVPQQPPWGASLSSGFSLSDGAGTGAAVNRSAAAAAASAPVCPRPSSSSGNCHSHAVGNLREREANRESTPEGEKVASSLLRQRHGAVHDIRMDSGMLLWSEKDETGTCTGSAVGKLRSAFSGFGEQRKGRGAGGGRAEGGGTETRTLDRKSLKRLEKREEHPGQKASSFAVEKRMTQGGGGGGEDATREERSGTSVLMVVWKDGSGAAARADVEKGAAAPGVNSDASEFGNGAEEEERGGGGGGGDEGERGICVGTTSAVITSASFSRRLEAVAGNSNSISTVSAAAPFTTTSVGQQQEKVKARSEGTKPRRDSSSSRGGSPEGGTKGALITLSLVKRRSGSSPKGPLPDRGGPAPKGPPTPPPLCLASISASTAVAGAGLGVSSSSGQGSSPCVSAGASPRASSPRSPETPSSGAAALHHHHHHHLQGLSQGNGMVEGSMEKANTGGGVSKTEVKDGGKMGNAVNTTGGAVCLSISTNRSFGSGTSCITAVRVKVVSSDAGRCSGGKVGHHNHQSTGTGTGSGSSASPSPPLQVGERHASSQAKENFTTSKGVEKSDDGVALHRMRATAAAEKKMTGSSTFPPPERSCGRLGGTGTLPAAAAAEGKEGVGNDVCCWGKGEEGSVGRGGGGSVSCGSAERQCSSFSGLGDSMMKSRGEREGGGGVRAIAAAWGEGECSGGGGGGGSKESRSSLSSKQGMKDEMLTRGDDGSGSGGGRGERAEGGSKFSSVSFRSVRETSCGLSSRAKDAAADEAGGHTSGGGEREKGMDSDDLGTTTMTLSSNSKEVTGGDLSAATRGEQPANDAGGVLCLSAEGLDYGSTKGGGNWDVPSGSSNKGACVEGGQKRKLRESASNHERNWERREFRGANTVKRTMVIPLGLLSRANKNSSSCAAVCTGGSVGGTTPPVSARDGGSCDESPPAGSHAAAGHVGAKGGGLSEAASNRKGGALQGWRGGESNQECDGHKGGGSGIGSGGQVSAAVREISPTLCAFGNGGGRGGCRSPSFGTAAPVGLGGGGAGGGPAPPPSVDCTASSSSSSFRTPPHQTNNGKSSTTVAVSGKSLLGFGASSGFGMATMISLPTTAAAAAALANGPRRA